MFDRKKSIPHRSALTRVVAMAVVVCAHGAIAQSPPKPFTGAAITTGSDFGYGRYEIRLKSARGSGIVSAFFLRASKKSSEGTLVHELDFEFMGKSPGLLHMACHEGIDNPSQRKQHNREKKNTQLPFDPTQDFHTYALEYTPTSIVWFADGKELWRLGASMAEKFKGVKMSLRCNIWSPKIIPWAGEIDRGSLPARYEIEYVSYAAYRDSTSGRGNEFSPVWKDEFVDSGWGRWSKANWTWGVNQAMMKPGNAVNEDGKSVLLLTEN